MLQKYKISFKSSRILRIYMAQTADIFKCTFIYEDVYLKFYSFISNLLSVSRLYTVNLLKAYFVEILGSEIKLFVKRRFSISSIICEITQTQQSMDKNVFLLW